MEIHDLLKEYIIQIDKTIEKYIPRFFSEDAILFKFIPPRYAHNLIAINKSITDPIWEFLDRGGKRWRAALFLIICEALGKNPWDYIDFAIIPEIIHNGTLIVDDIEDSSEYRRGKPSTYKVYGLDIATNAGNAMYFLPLLPLIENQRNFSSATLSKIYEIYLKEMISLSLGQGVDLAWHKDLVNSDRLTEKQYLQMCAFKTGTLARMAAKMAAVLADADDELVEKLGRFAESIGIAFQIQDDVLDLTSSDFTRQKGGFGQDITEGKKTLIVLRTLSIAEFEDKERLLHILKLHTPDPTLKEETLSLFQKYHSIEYAKQFARRILDESWKEVDHALPDSDSKKKLKYFSNFLIERNI